MYKQTIDGKGIVRLRDGALIPEDPSNADWLEFLAWKKKGNQPQPALDADEGRRAARMLLAQRRWEAQIKGVDVGGVVFPTDRDSVINLMAAWLAGYSGVWKIDDDTFVQVTPEDLQTIFAAGVTFVGACFADEADASALIGQAATAEEALAIAKGHEIGGKPLVALPVQAHTPKGGG